MKIFLDTANAAEIQAALELGLCDGVTTNPSLLAKEKGSPETILKNLLKIVPGPVNCECIALDAAGMIAEGKNFATWGKNVVVKIPMGHEGLKAVKALHDLGIPTNVTLIFSASQAFLAAKAGASYVSPFIGRLDDISQDGMQLIRDLAVMFRNYPALKTEILTASVRSPNHMVQAMLAGSHIATAPAKVLLDMEKHPLTDIGIQKFLDDYKKSQAAQAK